MANQVIYGIVNNKEKAEKLIQDILNLKLNPQDISCLCEQTDEFSELKGHKIRVESNRDWRTEERITDYPHPTSQENLKSPPKEHFKASKGALSKEKQTKTPEGTTTGGMVGGTFGLLKGLGTLDIPGVGPFIAAGPLMTILKGIRAGSEDVAGTLAGAGIAEYEAKNYQNRLEEGGILLAVRTNSDQLIKQLKDLFKREGATDISVSSEAMASKQHKK